jgi:Spy/CpxP family protein refolding chaperone
MINKKYFCILVFVAFIASANAQSNTKQTQKEQAYIKVIDQRAQKIVVTLEIKDAAKAERVKDIIASRYHQLNDWQNEEESKVKAVKAGNIADKAALKVQIASCQKEEEAKIDSSHKTYISALSKELTPQQVDKVKDGMSYDVLPVTYKGYEEMIPNLTEKQKAQIYAWLTEAREHAIDAGTSEKKHWWFGKYKGRINNYLSAQGYDLKKEEAGWQKRRDSAKAAIGK